MKVLVTYYSKTGNTKKVAEAMYDEIKDRKEIAPINEVSSFEGYDVVFFGLPIHQMGPDGKEKKMLGKYCTTGSNIVLFITHAAPENAPDLPPMLEKFRTAAGAANIVGMFDCQGALDKTTKRIMSVLPVANLRKWAKEDSSFGQPDASRIEKARVFARETMKAVKVKGKTASKPAAFADPVGAKKAAFEKVI